MYPQAAQIKTKETEFSKNLSAADTDVQKALETIDQLNLDGNHAGLSNLDYAHAGHTGFSPDTHNHDASYWGVSNDQTGLSGTKTGTYSLTTSGDITGYSTWAGDTFAGGAYGLPTFGAYDSPNNWLFGVIGIGASQSPALIWQDGTYLRLGTSPTIGGGFTGLVNIGSIYFQYGTVTDDGLAYQLIRNKPAGVFNTTWSMYIPASSTDLRWYNGSDLMTLTAAGNLTMTAGGSITTTGITKSGRLILDSGGTFYDDGVSAIQTNSGGGENGRISTSYVRMSNSGFPGPDPLFTYNAGDAARTCGIYGQLVPFGAQWRQLSILMDNVDFADFYSSDAGVKLITFNQNVDLVSNNLTTTGTGTFGSTYQAEIGNTSDSSAFYSDVPGFWGVSLNSVNGAGWFYDSAGNMVALTDGVNAINATGNSLFTGNVDVTTLVNTDYIYSITAPSSEINLATGTLFDASGWTSVDWHSRYLYASDGSTVMLDWSTDGTAQFGTQNIITTGTLGAGATTLTGNLTVGNNTTGRNAYIYATLGTEKVPSFDAGNWTCTGGWVANGTTLATTAVSGSITPSAVTNIVAGTTYKITMTISASSTSVYFDIGGASTIVTTWGGAGSYTWYVTTLTTAKLTISMASSGSGTITALSIKPFTDATGDLLVEGDLYLRSNVQTTNGINFIASDSNAAFRFTSASTSVLMGGAYLRFTGGTSYLDSSLAGNAGFVMRTSKTSALNGISYNFTSGGLGIGIAPTALLHLAAGTATAGTAPLKFTTQANLLTTPEAGAIEFKTDDFFATITTGAARKAFILDDGARLTATRVPFATTNGRLTDDTDMTFSGDTLTVTKIKSKHYCADGTSALADGTYTIFEGTYLGVMDGTITIKDGLIITYQTGGMPPP